MKIEVLEENGDIKYFYDITHKAKSIFGDIVKSAKQEIQCTYIGDEKFKKEIDAYNEYKISIIEKKDGLIFDEGEIIVEFINGKKVKMYTSEWGGAISI